MDARILHLNIRSAFRAVADLALPRCCVVCGRPLTLQEEHVCIPCLSDMPETSFAGRSRNPMADKFNALVEAQRYCYASALFFYDDEAHWSRIPQSLKYGRNFSAGRYFAAMLGDRLSAVPEFSDVDLVLPVPLHWTRRWRRGYNQAEVIAREVARRLGVPCRTDVLVRCRRTRTQTRLDVRSKMENVKSAFCTRRTPHAGHILLVDDVFTTGSTLAACHAALSRSCGEGVRISAATLAYVGE